MAKFSRPFLIIRRIAKLKENVKINTQKIRENLLSNLTSIFESAVKFAKGKTTINGHELTLKEREKWARIAAYTAQVINSVASGFDERQIDVQLDELERLVNEAKAKAKTKKTKRQVKGAKKEKVSKGSS